MVINVQTQARSAKYQLMFYEQATQCLAQRQEMNKSCILTRHKSSFISFECPFRAFECPFISFECRFKAYERRFILGLNTLFHRAVVFSS